MSLRFVRYLWPLLLMALVACGTAKVDIATTVHSPDDVEQQISMRAEGLIREAMTSQFKPELGSDGWIIERTTEGPVARIVMTKRGAPGAVLNLPRGVFGSRQPEAKLDVDQGMFGREYRLIITLPPSGITEGPLIGAEQVRQIEETTAQSFTMTWAVTLPGELTETNADRRTSNGGAWDLPYERLRGGLELKAASREGPSLVTLAGGAAVVLVLAVLGWYAYARGTRHGDDGSDPPDPPAP